MTGVQTCALPISLNSNMEMLQEKEQLLNEQCKQLKELQEKNEEQLIRLAENQEKVKLLEEKLKAIECSFTWKIFKPFRIISKKLSER